MKSVIEDLQEEFRQTLIRDDLGVALCYMCQVLFLAFFRCIWYWMQSGLEIFTGGANAVAQMKIQRLLGKGSSPLHKIRLLPYLGSGRNFTQWSDF